MLARGESSTDQGSGCIFPLSSLSTELIPEPKRAPHPQRRAGAAPAPELPRAEQLSISPGEVGIEGKRIPAFISSSAACFFLNPHGCSRGPQGARPQPAMPQPHPGSPQGPAAPSGGSNNPPPALAEAVLAVPHLRRRQSKTGRRCVTTFARSEEPRRPFPETKNRQTRPQPDILRGGGRPSWQQR